MTIAVDRETGTLPLNIGTVKFTGEQFEQLCVANPDRSLELTATGALIAMPPVGGESATSVENAGISRQRSAARMAD